MIITSVNNNYIKEINKLKEKKYRDLTGTFIVEGEDIVNEAIKNNLVKEIILLEGKSFPTDKKVITVSYQVMKKLSSMDSPSSLLAVTYKKKSLPIGNKILVLEDIQDPGNLGTIIRSSLAFEIDTLVLSPKTVDLYNPKVIRATKGAIFSLNIITRELVPFIQELKENNYKIYGTKVDRGVNIKDIAIPSKFALIMGNEGQGMSDSLSSLTDSNIYIKTTSQVESLNVAVATSILLYEVYQNGTN